MASVVRRLASRVRRGVSRRVNGVLDLVGERVGVRASSTDRSSPAPEPFAVRPEPDTIRVTAETVGVEPELEPTAEPTGDTGGPPLLTRQQVEELFEEMVRPALQSDGGDITLVRVQDNDVFVELTGACHSCPSSVITMQDGIERLLREEFPHFGRLVRVDGAG